MLKVFSHFFSAIFHPLLMPLYGVVILMRSGLLIAFIYEMYSRPIFVTIVGGTILLPLIVVFFLSYFKLIKSIFMEERKERVLPLAIVLVLYFLTYFWFKGNTEYTQVLQSFFLAISVIVLLLSIISYFWKVSIHMAGMGGMTALIFLLYHHLDYNLFIPVILTILCSGIVGTSRLLMGAHKPAQVYVGYFIGLVVMFSVLRF